MLKTILTVSLLATPVLAQNMDGMQMNGSAHDQMTMQGMQPGEGGMGANGGMAGMPGMHGGMHGGNGGMGMQGMGGMEGMPKMQGMEGMMEMMSGMMKMMQAMQSMHGGMMGNAGDMGAMQMDAPAAGGMAASPLTEGGQSAFAAIAEVVDALKADPNTDWSKVNIDALREHLRDMDIVTIDSHAVAEPVEGGIRFVVTGDADVSPSIERMVMAHARVMDGVDDWKYSAEIIPGGAALTVIVPDADLPKLKALGFYGLMASGMHHQPHHWMMATGGNPHQ